MPRDLGRPALYARVSSMSQARDDRYGLERQEVEVRAYVTQLGRTPDRGRADRRGLPDSA